MKNITARPAEAVALIGIAAPVYAFLKDGGVPAPWAAIIAIVCGLVPLAISTWRDTVKPPDDPGDDDPEGGPPEPKLRDAPPGTEPKDARLIETQGIDHAALDAAVSNE